MNDYFTIYRADGDSPVEIDDAFDKRVCDALGLEYNHVNEIGIRFYGLFYFPECMKDPDVFGGQEFIPWVGFLNTVIEYSNIYTGRVTKYDMEAALAWCMSHSVEFPRSSKLLMTKFMNFIDGQGYYLKVIGHKRKIIYNRGYVNHYDKSRIIENDTGYFLIDSVGCLQRFFPKQESIEELNNCPCFNYDGGSRGIKYVKIPIEVNYIYNDFIDGECYVIDKLSIGLDSVVNIISKEIEHFDSIKDDPRFEKETNLGKFQLLQEIVSKCSNNYSMIEIVRRNNELIKSFLSFCLGSPHTHKCILIGELILL